MTLFLAWFSGVLAGLALGIHYWHRRTERFRQDCLALAMEAFDALVAEWRQENRREERLGR